MLYMELLIAALLLLTIVFILSLFTKLLKSHRKQEISVTVRDFSKGRRL